tara:strand:+ start:277 stop:633 length:357 start_codon:yes stop_codon:yes gene_type:complete
MENSQDAKVEINKDLVKTIRNTTKDKKLKTALRRVGQAGTNVGSVDFLIGELRGSERAKAAAKIELRIQLRDNGVTAFAEYEPDPSGQQKVSEAKMKIKASHLRKIIQEELKKALTKK